jgi:ribonuclease D
MKGAKALRGRSLAVLRELYEWREGLARSSDRAAFRILNNEPMLLIAKSPPREISQLKTIRGISPEQAERRGRDIMAAIERALMLPERELPRLERTRRPVPDPAYDARLERLKTARNSLAQHYNLPPGVLCPNGTLEAIARVNPQAAEEMARVRELRRWQLRELGSTLFAALKQPASAAG